MLVRTSVWSYDLLNGTSNLLKKSPSWVIILESEIINIKLLINKSGSRLPKTYFLYHALWFCSAEDVVTSKSNDCAWTVTLVLSCLCAETLTPTNSSSSSWLGHKAVRTSLLHFSKSLAIISVSSQTKPNSLRSPFTVKALGHSVQSSSSFTFSFHS